MENIDIKYFCCCGSIALFLTYLLFVSIKYWITGDDREIYNVKHFIYAVLLSFSGIPILWISNGNIKTISILYIILLYFAISPVLNYYIANIYKKLKKIYNNYKIIHTTYSIKKLDNEQLLGIDTDDIYCLYETYKNHSKSICVDSLSKVTEEYNKLTNYKNELINKKLMKLKNKNTNLYTEYNDNTINLIINTK